MYEDLIADMQMILQTMAHTVTDIAKTCQRHCEMTCGAESVCSCRYMIEEFQEYVVETQQYLERAQILMGRVQSTAHLVGKSVITLPQSSASSPSTQQLSGRC